MRDEERRQEARRALDRAARESESLGQSQLAQAGRRVADHFVARDAAESDPVEVWGRRIGRGLSVVGVVVLTAWLGVQLGWW